MATQPDLPTPPVTWKAMIEFYKCWPGFLPELLAYVPIMERIALLVSSQGFMIFDNVWRADVFENGVPFLRAGALPARIAVELQCVMAHHLRPAPDAAALSCGNCGRQHRAEECPSFALSFKNTQDPSGPRLRRGRSSSRKRARSLSDSSSPPPAAAHHPKRAPAASPNSDRPSPSPLSSSRTSRLPRPASSGRTPANVGSVRRVSSRIKHQCLLQIRPPASFI
jgi:hypothetical protein